jgi:hypothetical protein
MQFWSHYTKISRTTKFHCGNTRERHETLKHIARDIVSCNFSLIDKTQRVNAILDSTRWKFLFHVQPVSFLQVSEILCVLVVENKSVSR